MGSKKSSDLYSDEELKKIKEEWLRDQGRIDANPAFDYYRDKDKEYERHLCNANLRMLFRHAAWLKSQQREGQQLQLYSGEAALISDAYREIIQNGYFARSKETEKKVRAWLGKIVSRQHRPKGK